MKPATEMKLGVKRSLLDTYLREMCIDIGFFQRRYHDEISATITREKYKGSKETTVYLKLCEMSIEKILKMLEKFSD